VKTVKSGLVQVTLQNMVQIIYLQMSQLRLSFGRLINMHKKHKKMLKMTHETGLTMLEDMNMLMFGFGPDAAEYKKKRSKK